MKTLPTFLQLEKYRISPLDVVRMTFRCAPDAIRPDVILMPWWKPAIFSPWVDQITTITEDILYEIEYKGKPISVIRSGIGAPQAGDTTLALGCTPCQRILFAGSVGGLRPEMRVGDLMLAEYSVSGDGYCRYLEADPSARDCFLDRTYPDETLSQALARSLAPLAQEAGVSVHTGPIFCIDTILAQFSRLEFIAKDLGCAGIEMETAAVFKAARLVGIQAAPLFSISDVPVIKKSLYSGRSEEEKEARREIRSKVLARALLECLMSGIPSPAGG